jgi:hypothetical protein
MNLGWATWGGGAQSGQSSSIKAGSFYGIAAYQSQPAETSDVLASRRNHPANGFINPNGVIDLVLETQSAADGDLGDDRVDFDNFNTYISTSSAEKLRMSLSDHSAGDIELTTPTLPGHSDQLLRGNQLNALEPSAPRLKEPARFWLKRSIRRIIRNFS